MKQKQIKDTENRLMVAKAWGGGYRRGMDWEMQNIIHYIYYANYYTQNG